MAATVSGAKTVTTTVAPHLTGTTLTTILAKAVENLTIADLRTLQDAISRVSSGHEPTKTIGALLS